MRRAGTLLTQSLITRCCPEQEHTRRNVEPAAEIADAARQSPSIG